jgi:hypothetical protein
LAIQPDPGESLPVIVRQGAGDSDRAQTLPRAEHLVHCPAGGGGSKRPGILSGWAGLRRHRSILPETGFEPTLPWGKWIPRGLSGGPAFSGSYLQ